MQGLMDMECFGAVAIEHHTGLKNAISAHRQKVIHLVFGGQLARVSFEARHCLGGFMVNGLGQVRVKK